MNRGQIPILDASIEIAMSFLNVSHVEDKIYMNTSGPSLTS